MAAMIPEREDRVLVAAYCSECKDGYTMIMGRDWTWHPQGYCSKPCSKRAYQRRYHSRCPVGCGRKKRSSATVCGDCWMTVTGMCRGKRRLSERDAKKVQATRSWLAVWCRCCGWWHNTSHPANDEADLVRQVGEILEAMRRVKGKVWLNELIETWDPEMFDRHAWKRERI